MNTIRTIDRYITECIITVSTERVRSSPLEMKHLSQVSWVTFSSCPPVSDVSTARRTRLTNEPVQRATSITLYVHPLTLQLVRHSTFYVRRITL